MPRTRSSRRGSLRAVLALAAGAGLVALAWPHLAAHLAARAAAPAMALLQAGELPTAEGFARIERSLSAARAQAPLPAFDRDLGLARLALAQQAPADSAERRAGLEAAREALERTVAAAPVQPGSLALLAYVCSELDRDDEAVASLRRGWQLAPYAPEPGLVRSWVAVLYWDRLDAADRQRAGRDFRAAMALDPDSFVAMVADADMLGAARQALRAEPALLEQLELRVQARGDQPA